MSAVEDFAGKYGNTIVKNGTFSPPTAVTKRLTQYNAYKKGWLICFGMDQFYGYSFSQFGVGTPPNPNMFNIPNVNVAAWAIEAAATGVQYAILTVKSELGHLMWNTKTDNPIKSCTIPTRPGGFTTPFYRKNDTTNVADPNILSKFITEFRSRGIEVGCYISPATDFNCADGFPADNLPTDSGVRLAYLDYMCALAQELVRDYGVTLLWVDHYESLTTAENQALYNAVKSVNIQCLIIGNDHGDTGFIRYPSDVQSTEAGLFPVNGYKSTAHVFGGTTYYVPQEIVFTPMLNFQYYIFDSLCPSQPPYMPQQYNTLANLQAIVNEGRTYGCPMLCTIPIDRYGVMDPTSLALINGLTIT